MGTRSRRLETEKVWHALGDPTRRAIVEDLCKRPTTVTHLANSIGISLTAVGQHLAILENCGLAKSEKVGRVRTCRFDTRGLAVLESWINDHRLMWEQNLDRLGNFLSAEEED